jgi:hypothetical protein
VIEGFFADPEKTGREAGIEHFALAFQGSTERRVCRICCDECPAADLIAMGCGHFFCRPCFTQYLVSKVCHRQPARSGGVGS